MFSGGIGEHAPIVRTRICSGLEFLGVQIDEQENAANGPLISTPAASVAVYVIPTDEEMVIAKMAYGLLQ